MLSIYPNIYYRTGKNTYTFEFDFRFQGASDFRADGSRDIVYNNGIGGVRGTTSSKGLGNFSASADGNSLTMNGVEMKKGEWHHVVYKYVWNGTDYTISVIIDGAEVISNRTGTEISFIWEIRWGNLNADKTAGYSDLYFDLDNITYTVAD